MCSSNSLIDLNLDSQLLQLKFASSGDDILVCNVHFIHANAFARQDHAGANEVLKELSVKTRGLKIKILVPKNERAEELRIDLKHYNIDVKYIQEFSQTKISILVVDRTKSLVIELQNDNALNTLDAMGTINLFDENLDCFILRINF